MPLTDAQLWAAALGYLLPPIMAIVIQPRWSGPIKGLFMLLVAAGDGAGTSYFNHDFTGKPVVTSMLIAAVAIGLAYHTLWKPSGIAPSIEQATSTNGGRTPLQRV
ncbi:hypothetical protein OG824_32040 [Streptomyces prunicolor]|uniref:hypothetical protein n=1 Tax=Streptomyces prunicolor TaxID=67348 RepID=UPI00224F59E2|nr:hypothetical protein [Streptomyces prunicolor]MCX5239843.1 hypothetical protein [Streptomyces prunicolor]